MLRSQGGKKRVGTAASPLKLSLQPSGVQTNQKQHLGVHSTRNQFVGSNAHTKQLPPATASMEDELGNLLEEDIHNHQSKALTSASTSAAPPQYITVSLDDLEEAGIDVRNVNKLTEPQIQNLLAISEQNRKRLTDRQAAPANTPSGKVNSVSISSQALNERQSPCKSAYKTVSSPFRDGLRPSTSQQHSDSNSVYRGVESEVESVVEVENVVEDELGVNQTTSPRNTNGPPRLTREQVRREPETMEEEDEDLPGSNGADSQITITITDEGHVKLTDASHQTFFFSRDELSQRNIDAANLTDANIQDIIQMALPSLVMGRPDSEEPSSKKRQLSHSQSTSSNHIVHNSLHKGSALQEVHPTHLNGVSSSSSTIGQAPCYSTRPSPNLSGISVTPSTSSKPPPLYFNRREQLNTVAGNIMIGEEVEVRRQGNAGRRETAVVRYFRPGYGYKVQFSDSHFEWITEGNVQDTKEAQPLPFRSRTRPHAQIYPIQPTNHIRKTDSNVHSPTNNHQKHHFQTRMISDSASMSSNTNHLQKKSPTPSQQSNSKIEESQVSADNMLNNFYCSICDQTVSQNELSYIVIRVLACKPCSTSKVLILDDQEEGVNKEERSPKSLPSTLSQTNDGLSNRAKKQEPSCISEPKHMNRGRALSTPKEIQLDVQHKAETTVSSVRSNAKTFVKEIPRIL